jgi:ABC-type polysaccharide/polyol phosphate export permease
MFTAPLSAYAKDVRYTITYLMQIWYFVTPIAQPLSQYHGVVYRIAEFNPITAPLMLVQWGFLGTSFPPTASVLTSIISITVLALAASWVFGRFETMDVKRL